MSVYIKVHKHKAFLIYDPQTQSCLYKGPQTQSF